MRRFAALPLVALALSLGACVFSTASTIRFHQLLHQPAPALVNSFNMEEQIELGFVPEVLAFLSGGGPRVLEDPRTARVLGRALLERGDFRGARAPLETAHAKEARLTERSEDAWLLAQAHYWDGTFGESARWCRIARSEGRSVPEGWILFLESGAARRPYEGVAPGERVRETFAYGRPNIVRVPVRVNGAPAEPMVFDTGASISLVTESAARRFGLEMVEGAKAAAHGLHDTEIPLAFAWARELHLGGVTLRNVPFGVLADDALAFETSSSTGSLRFSGVLGVHVLKEFDWRVAYAGSQLTGVRLDPAIRRGGSKQNLFFRRLKPMVRASFNQEPWFLFLLDTGSEPTMVTRAGILRRGGRMIEATYPMTLEGIGKSRVSWGKLSNATVGVDRYMVRFDDLVVKEDNAGIEDGVVGSSFLGRFDVEIRFGEMRLTLERPFERGLEARADAVVAASR